jgi:hypothetical protein
MGLFSLIQAPEDVATLIFIILSFLMLYAVVKENAKATKGKRRNPQRS